MSARALKTSARTDCSERVPVERAHAVWDIKYHLVWITKYRYKMLRGDVAERPEVAVERRRRRDAGRVRSPGKNVTVLI
jgi:hypothetical protein